MTVSPVDATPPDPIVKPDEGSRLAQLTALYDQLKAAAEHTAAQFEACKAAIKSEVVNAHPGAPAVRVDSPDLAEPLRVFYRSQTRIDSKRLKVEQPETYAQYAKASGSWVVGAAKS